MLGILIRIAQRGTSNEYAQYFCGEIRKIYGEYPFLFGAMYTFECARGERYWGLESETVSDLM